jgi:bacillithiol synthase
VTGQQVGLFLGPLYTFYKAASAIAVARVLEVESGTRCVPVFWLQTEDHDYPEVNHCCVPGPGGSPEQIALAEDSLDAPDRRASLSHRILGAEVTRALDSLREALKGLPDADRVMGLAHEFYRPGHGLAVAFASLLAALFADEGLLVLDPRDPAVLRLAQAAFAGSIVRSDVLTGALEQRSGALEAAGFEVQVPIRPSASLCFFHVGSASGPRFRLERQGDGWAAGPGNRAGTTAELLRLLESDPLRFSTSALLRPIVQDALLPTAAYVAGPSELNYFAQMAPLYRAFELPAPVIVPRARFRLVDERTRGLLSKLGLEPQDAESPSMPFGIGSVPQGTPSPAALRGQLLDDVVRRLDALYAAAVDPALPKAVLRTRESIRRNVDRLIRRYERALRDKDGTAAARLQKVRDCLCPRGVPQERFYSVLPFLARHGMQAFKARVFDALEPFSGAVRDLSP